MSDEDAVAVWVVEEDSELGETCPACHCDLCPAEGGWFDWLGDTAPCPSCGARLSLHFDESIDGSVWRFWFEVES